MPGSRLTVGLDTSFVVPLFSSWHSFHPATVAEYEALRRRRSQLVLPLHALLESFSVLTRLPEGRRFSPAEAHLMLQQAFSTDTVVPGLEPELVWSCIARLSREGVAGGRVYDAVIAHTAAQAGATVMLTWNEKDFLAVAPPGLEIRRPGGPPARGSRIH